MNLRRLSFSMLLALGVLSFSSCEEETASPEVTQNDTEVASEEESVNADFHMHFDASLSREEVEVLWAEAKEKHHRELAKQGYQRPTNILVTEIWTYTGTGKWNDTDDKVEAIITFDVSGGQSVKTVNLDEKGRDDREGGWDLFERGLNVGITSFAYIDKCKMRLTGNDGWKCLDFWVILRAGDQIEPATGGASLHNTTDFWLDNDNPKYSNTFTKDIGGNSGALIFPG